MKNNKALRSTLIVGTAMAASLIAAPTMAELNQECLFTGEIVQKQADALKSGYGIDDGEKYAAVQLDSSRSKVQFKTSDIQALPEVSKSCIGIRNSKMATPRSCCQQKPQSNLDVPIKKSP